MEKPWWKIKEQSGNCVRSAEGPVGSRGPTAETEERSAWGLRLKGAWSLSVGVTGGGKCGRVWNVCSSLLWVYTVQRSPSPSKASVHQIDIGENPTGSRLRVPVLCPESQGHREAGDRRKVASAASA